ncbi:type VII secretion protein EssB [Virgibacillus sp. MSJ-26]|uniref:type VII secretion protein EssB n=1 Tax=Virgibacillus sp. MSJ-26 TaxID=2841522 RepID=UPI001C120F4C|nr:type VII secretion protein EssB [Virgibacillus sp. MSJ-26]
MPQDEKSRSYLENKLDTKITYDSDKIEFVFQRAKVKLSDELEIHLLKTINPEFNKEFTLTEDQVIITYHPPKSYARFENIYKNSIRAKWQFAYNVIRAIRSHSIERAKLIVSPENILFDQGLVPHFLHYGISESIPPYEDNEERLWKETKAIIAVIADNKHDFATYLAHYETMDLPDVAKAIMHSESYEEIIDIIKENIQKDDAYEKTVIHIPESKWKVRRYMIWILTVLLIPAMTYSVFALFFKIPESDAYVESNRHFLQDEYSSVVDTLSKFNHEKMPRVVQYELASSYIVSESLSEEQRENIQNTITLQADRKYFLYWIDIGRGNYQEAVDTARLLEDRDLIIYGLLKLREDVKTDQSLSGSEREDELKEIQREIDEYQQEMEEEKKEAEEEENQKQDNKIEESSDMDSSEQEDNEDDKEDTVEKDESKKDKDK